MVGEILEDLARSIACGAVDREQALEQAIGLLEAIPPLDRIAEGMDLACEIDAESNSAKHLGVALLQYDIARRTDWWPVEMAFANAANLLSQDVRKKRESNDYEKALAAYESLAALCRDNGHACNWFAAVMSQGNICQVDLGKADPKHLERARDHYREALRIAKQTGLPAKDRADALLELGKTSALLGEVREAIEQLRECLNLYRACEEEQRASCPETLSCLSALLNAYRRTSERRERARVIQEIMERVSETQTLAALAGELAGVLFPLDHAASQAHLQRSLALASSLDDPKAASEVRTQVFAGYARQRELAGDLQGAIDSYQTAIEEAEATNDKNTAARWLHNRAQISLRLGQLEEAEEGFRKAAFVHANFQDHMAAANCLISLGIALRLRRQEIRSASAFRMAFALYRRLGRQADMGLARFHLGEVHEQRGDPRRAMRCFHYCALMARKAGDLRYEAFALRKIADLHAKQKEKELAAQTYASALELAQRTGDVLNEQELRLKYGLALEELSPGDPQAEAQYHKAIALLEATRSRFRAAEPRMQLQVRQLEPYEPLIRLLVSHRPDSAAEALLLAERMRSRTLGELLSRRPLPHPPSLPGPLAQRETQLLEELAAMEQSAAEGMGQEERYRRLSEELRQVWDQIAQVDSDCQAYVELRRTPQLSFADIARLLSLESPRRE